MSPSSRRAWIEISKRKESYLMAQVALLAEGVDRNNFRWSMLAKKCRSPSSRRAWIEITKHRTLSEAGWWSPSSRRAWIEM